MAATTATIPRTGKSGSRSSSADKDYVVRTRCTTLATRHPSSVQKAKMPQFPGYRIDTTEASCQPPSSDTLARVAILWEK